MLVDVKQTKHRITDEGVLVVFDKDRDKWLSAARCSYPFSLNHMRVKGPRWLRMAGTLASNVNGYLLPRIATVTAITVRAKQAGIGDFRVNALRAGSHVPVQTVSLSSEREKVVDNLNIDLQVEDSLTAELVDGVFHYPALLVEVAWKF